MIYPDFALRTMITATISRPQSRAQGGEVVAKIAIPPTRSSFTKYFPGPHNTDVIYHVMVGPGSSDLRQGNGRVLYPAIRGEIFGFIRLAQAVDLASPGLEFLEGFLFLGRQSARCQADQSEYDKA